jgi:hypothetical protein
VHRNKNGVDADKRNPKMKLANAFVQVAAKHFGEPEVRGREHTEDRRDPHHQVEVRGNDVSIVHGQIERSLSED